MTTARYNVVVICLDTFRADFALGQAAWTADVPALTRLRAESTVCSAAFGEGFATIPMRRAYFTGEPSFPWRYAFDTKGMWPTGRGWHKIPPRQQTLAEMLLDAGYATGLVADTYHMFKPTMNFTRGFASYDFVRGYESDNWKSGHVTAAELRPYVRAPARPEDHPILVQHLLNARTRSQESDWSAARVFDRAAEWVEEQPGYRPFFLWVDSFSPHEPWDPPARFVERYISSYHGTRFIYPISGPQDFTAEEATWIRAAYRGYLSFVDERLSRLLAALERPDLRERTIVVVLSDHGTELGEHGRFSKTASHLFAHNTRLLWMMRHPAVPASTYDGFVQSVDLAPTLCDMLGLPPLGSGVSLWPAMQGRAAGTGRDHVISGWGSYAAVRDPQWNYIVNFEDPRDLEALYHVAVDPGEQVNVLDAERQQAARLRRRLETLLDQELPARLADEVQPGVAPIRRLLGTKRAAVAKDSGFV